MSVEIALTLLLAGVVMLDATPAGQTLLSQPLVTASLLGLLWGDWTVALSVGIVLQILAASTLPVGARTPEDYAMGGIVGVTLALLLAAEQPYAMARDASRLIGVFAGLLAAIAGVPVLRAQRRWNEGLARWVEARLRSGHENAPGLAQAAAIVLAFAIGVTFAAVFLGLGVWVLRPLVAHESIRLARAWALAEPLWLGLGLAQLLAAFVQRRLTRAALFGAALLATWLVVMVAS